jgi:hypothetical protein
MFFPFFLPPGLRTSERISPGFLLRARCFRGRYERDRCAVLRALDELARRRREFRSAAFWAGVPKYLICFADMFRRCLARFCFARRRPGLMTTLRLAASATVLLLSLHAPNSRSARKPQLPQQKQKGLLIAIHGSGVSRSASP